MTEQMTAVLFLGLIILSVILFSVVAFFAERNTLPARTRARIKYTRKVRRELERRAAKMERARRVERERMRAAEIRALRAEFSQAEYDLRVAYRARIEKIFND